MLEGKKDFIDYEDAPSFSCDVMKLHIFPYCDLSLNYPNDESEVIDLAALSQANYGGRMQMITSSSVELMTACDDELQFSACIELEKNRRQGKMVVQPHIGVKDALNSSDTLRGYTLESPSSPDPHRNTLSLYRHEQLAALITYTREKSHSYFEINIPIKNTSPQATYDDIQFGCSLWALTQSGIAAAYDVGTFKLPPDQMNVFIGQTGHGTATDLQIALLGQIGKKNVFTTSEDKKLRLSDDINGAALDHTLGQLTSIIPTSDYRNIAESILEDTQGLIITHQDILRAIQERLKRA